MKVNHTIIILNLKSTVVRLQDFGLTTIKPGEDSEFVWVLTKDSSNRTYTEMDVVNRINDI